MRKFTALMALILSLAALSGCAQGAAEAVDYEQYLPEGARYVKEEPEDGGTEVVYEGEGGEKYKLIIDKDGVVRALEMHKKRAENYAAPLLTELGAFEIVQARFPDAQLLAATVRDDKSGQVWVMIFTGGDSLYAYEMEAGVGDVLDYTRFFGYTPDANPLAQILLSYPAAAITRLSFDLEDGRPRYEGDALVSGIAYEFAVDHATGQLLEWEMDD